MYKTYSLLFALLLLISSSLAYGILTEAYPLHIYTTSQNVVIMVLRNNSLPIIVYTNATIDVNGTVKIFTFSYDPRVIVVPNNTEIQVNKETSIYIQVYRINQNTSALMHNTYDDNKSEFDFISNILPAVLIIIGFLLLLRNANKNT